jgi:hypothetical protein
LWPHALKNSKNRQNVKRRKKEKNLHAKSTNVSHKCPKLPLLKASPLSFLRVSREESRLKELRRVFSSLRPFVRV